MYVIISLKIILYYISFIFESKVDYSKMCLKPVIDKDRLSWREILKETKESSFTNVKKTYFWRKRKLNGFVLDNFMHGVLLLHNIQDNIQDFYIH